MVFPVSRAKILNILLFTVSQALAFSRRPRTRFSCGLRRSSGSSLRAAESVHLVLGKQFRPFRQAPEALRLAIPSRRL
jgi:hypothetical protein